jgi:hypothetical protein
VNFPGLLEGTGGRRSFLKFFTKTLVFAAINIATETHFSDNLLTNMQYRIKDRLLQQKKTKNQKKQKIIRKNTYFCLSTRSY